jgi:hypothetical protein
VKRLSRSDILKAVQRYDNRHAKPEIEKEVTGDPEALSQLAAWRREGHGVWYGSYVADGFDAEYRHMCPGRFSKPFATSLMKVQCAVQLGCSVQHVHLVSIKKES